MSELNIAKFDPERASVIALVANVKNTIISLPAGNTGYALMRENKSLLQKKRTDLTRMFKDERAGALAYQKGIIAIEKDLLGLMAPVEMDLDAKISKIDEENARAKRVKDLPDRMERLKLIECEASPDELLSMDDNQFLEFFNQKKLEYLERKEQAIKDAEEKRLKEQAIVEQNIVEERERVDKERLAKLKAEEDARQAKIKAEDDVRQAKIQAEADEMSARLFAVNEKMLAERAILRAEQDKIDAEKKRIADEALKVEQDKQRAIELEAAKKKAAEDAERRIGEELLAKEERERVKKAKFEAQEKYQQFLKANNYTPDDIVKTEGNKTTLYRKVAEIIIN